MGKPDSQSISNFLDVNVQGLAPFASDSADALQALDGAGLQSVVDDSRQLTIESVRYALSCSPFSASVASHHCVEWLALLQATDGELPELSQWQAEVKALGRDAKSLDSYMSELRVYRNLWLSVIALYDLTGVWSLQQVLAALSNLADVCIIESLARAEASLQPRYGCARDTNDQLQSMIVVAMGKLGGRELNFSSDIDLVFLYRDGGQTDGAKSIDCEVYFRRLGQLLVKILDEVTADGFVYRVDTRLRPHGRSGALAIQLGAMDKYLLSHGRDWERFAWIKSRVIAGDSEDSSRLAQMLEPFIYRRYYDYAVLDQLRDLKRQIVYKIETEGGARNIKLGRGSIREVEFITQVHQLVRGGREVTLRSAELKKTLNAVADLNLLAEDVVTGLHNAYDFFRNVENRLQMVADKQTHELPLDDKEKKRLALSMCYSSYAEFETDLDQHRDLVQQVFDDVFSFDNDKQSASVDGDSPHTNLHEVCESLQLADANIALATAALDAQKIAPSAKVVTLLLEFYQRKRYLRYQKNAKELIDRLIPKSLELLSDTVQADTAPSHDITLDRILDFLDTVSGRSGYLQLLLDSEETHKNLVALFSQSLWVSDYIRTHPMVLDELTEITGSSVLRTVDQNLSALQDELKNCPPEDLGELMDRVRHYKQACTVKIATADIYQLLPVMQVSDALTWLAEAVLQVAVNIVGADMRRRFGVPACVEDSDRVAAGFAVAAYGKLGGIELGFGSDLDIVFLYRTPSDDNEDLRSDGETPLHNQVYFSRFAQKVVHFLSTPTAAGTLYEIDTRLRPNGRSGVLVTSFAAFREYQLKSAWTWEHQALVRARVVVGSEKRHDEFSTIRTQVLQALVKPGSLRNDVRDMREKMRRELDVSTEQQFDLKQGSGGIADIEFMVQYLIMSKCCDHRELLVHTDNVRQLEALAAGGHLNKDAVDRLTQAYLYYRGLVHARSIQLKDRELPDEQTLQTHRKAVIGCWNELMAGTR